LTRPARAPLRGAKIVSFVSAGRTHNRSQQAACVGGWCLCCRQHQHCVYTHACRLPADCTVEGPAKGECCPHEGMLWCSGSDECTCCVQADMLWCSGMYAPVGRVVGKLEGRAAATRRLKSDSSGLFLRANTMASRLQEMGQEQFCECTAVASCGEKTGVPRVQSCPDSSCPSLIACYLHSRELASAFCALWSHRDVLGRHCRESKQRQAQDSGAGHCRRFGELCRRLFWSALGEMLWRGW
jgi:hypothetical protein